MTPLTADLPPAAARPGAPEGLAAFARDVDAGADRLRDPFLFGLRLIWGAQFALAGLGKLAHPDAAAAAFEGWGFPAPAAHAWLAGGVETVGGLLLLVGLGTRPAALALSVVMLLALGTAHRAELLAATPADPTPLFTALPTSYLLAALTLLFVGPGRWSGDRVLSAPAGRVGVSA